MPRTQNKKQFNAFVRGLITEASPLTFPENASLGEDNFILQRDGSRSRRLGLGRETSGTNVPCTPALESKTAHYWRAGTAHIGVVQIDNKLYFLDMLSEAPSSSLLNGGASLELPTSAPIEGTVVNDVFVFVSSNSTSSYLSYDEVEDTVSITAFDIKVRDFWGVDDGLGVDERPSTLSTLHHYNLKNQGWTDAIETQCGGGITAVQCCKNQIDVYPSNADVWTLGKDVNVSSKTYLMFSAYNMKRLSLDYAYSPKGKYLLDIYTRGSSRASISGLTGLPTDLEAGRLTTTCTYAGRIWYSGIQSKVVGGDGFSPNLSSFVFFSNLVRSNDDLGKCYQEADPTSEEISDIIDTDGGVIHIPEAINIKKIVPFKNSLVVFSENGVWEVFGEQGGFNATSYQTSKITNVGIDYKRSVVVTDSGIFYWSKGGIYGLSFEQVSGRLQAQNISLLSIQTYYTSISETDKAAVRGFYDEREGKVRWLYSNKELIFDTAITAFYPHSTSNRYELVDYVYIPNYTSSAVNEAVLVGSTEVVVGSDPVVVPGGTIASRVPSFAFLVYGTTFFTLAKYQERSFLDWSLDDYSSYLITGYDILGDASLKKQVKYILFYFSKTEDGYSDAGNNLVELDNPSSCLVQAQWNWANSANSGKWGSTWQAYRFNRNYLPSGPSDTFDWGESVIVTKNKLRGSGRCISLKIQSESGKDMKLLGWVLDANGTGAT